MTEICQTRLSGISISDTGVSSGESAAGRSLAAPVLRYLWALAIFAVAIAIRFLVLPVEAGLAFLTFYPATAIAALLCGTWPGMLVVALGAVIGPYVFMAPFWSFKFPLDQIFSAATFTLSGMVVCFIAHRMRHRTTEVSLLNAKLEAAVERLRQREAELATSNGELEQFAYVASHDLRAPLRGIRNLAGWIKDDVTGKVDDEAMENLDLLQRRAERLDLLLEGLLEYSRIGRMDGGVEPVDIRRVVSDIADYISPPPGFSLECRGDMPELATHRAALEQVLRNLISNAVKHHDRPDGRVAVSCHDCGDSLEFSVTDDGPGIPPEYHESIFKMFQTLKSRDQVEGSGMGLAIVKKAVERHGGTIRVESDPTRRGTAFVFTWGKGV